MRYADTGAEQPLGSAGPRQNTSKKPETCFFTHQVGHGGYHRGVVGMGYLRSIKQLDSE